MAAFHFSINTCTMNEHGNMQFTCSNASTIPGSLILLGQAVARIPEDDRRAADLAAEQCKSEWERYNILFLQQENFNAQVRTIGLYSSI